LQHMEHEFLWLYRRSKEMTVAKGGSVIQEKAQTVASAIENFRDRANKNDRFVKFKTLVGFQSVFPLEWDSDGMDVEGLQRYRDAKIKEYADSITAENADEWLEVIERCASVKSNDLATFPSFGGFLKQLAARSPTIVVGYLTKSEETLSNFIPAVLAGIAESDRPDVAGCLVEKWIGQGRHLHPITRYLQLATDTSEGLVTKVGEEAVTRKDAIVTIGVIATIIARRLTSLVDTVLIPSIQMLTDLKDARWVDGCWFLQSLAPFLEELSERQCEILLKSMILRERIEYHDERILCTFAAKYPRRVLEFFRDRIHRSDPNESERQYEAIPYHMPELGKVLARKPKLVLELARSWYSSGDNLFTYTGGRLLERIFPHLTQEYEMELTGLVRDGGEDDLNFVLSLLQSYRGSTFLHELCKVLIEALPEGDKRIGTIVGILDSTGVVSGEFGMVEAYQRKKEEMRSWLGDPRSKVRAFAQTHIRTLDGIIASEQRRAENNHELRRRDWPEGDA
jgi:hypothetical protein